MPIIYNMDCADKSKNEIYGNLEGGHVEM